MMAAGIVLVIVGALISVGIYSQLSQTQEVLVVVAPVARGEQIARADLASVHVGFDALLTPLPASQLNQVIGQYAASDLVVGSFLTAGAVSPRLSPPSGRAEIGVALMSGAYPNDDLRPGDEVLLVAVPETGETIENTGGFAGTLVTIAASQSNTMITASVLVDAADAPTIAILAASNRLAMILTSRER